MDPGSITIKARQIVIEGQATGDAKSPMTTVEGSDIAIVKGGLVKINEEPVFKYVSVASRPP